MRAHHLCAPISLLPTLTLPSLWSFSFPSSPHWCSPVPLSAPSLQEALFPALFPQSLFPASLPSISPPRTQSLWVSLWLSLWNLTSGPPWGQWLARASPYQLLRTDCWICMSVVTMAIKKNWTKHSIVGQRISGTLVKNTKLFGWSVPKA